MFVFYKKKENHRERTCVELGVLGGSGELGEETNDDQNIVYENILSMKN